MVAVVAFATFVGSDTPFMTMVVNPVTNPVPVIVTVVAAAPATALIGSTLAMVGTARFTASETEFDAPPPGSGFNTDILSVPGCATSPASSVACNWLGFTYVVVRFALLTTTVDSETKFFPKIVIVELVPDAAGSAVGVIDEIEGVGL